MRFDQRMRGWVGVAAMAMGVMTVGGARLDASTADASTADASTADAAGLPNAGAMTMPSFGQRYTLRLHHLHTGESIDVVYRIGNVYLPEAVEKLNYFLRDHRTQDETSYDPREFDLLHDLMTRLRRPAGVIDIVCGYRTPESNEYLRTRAEVTGVAEHSQHMEGHAIDIRVPGVSTLMLRNAALALGEGGVGYYPVSQFVHVDVGPVREWQFGGFRRVRGTGRRRTHHRRVG